MRVLVVTESTGDQRKTLAAVRSLGQQQQDGVHVSVTVGSDRFPLGPEQSRYCTYRLVLPSPVSNPDDFARALVQHARHYDVLLPLSDHTTIPAVVLKEELAQYGTATALPPLDSYRVALDKHATALAAARVGLATPRTWCIESEDDLESRILPQLAANFPCVYKLRQGAGAIGLSFPQSPDQLREAYRKHQVLHGNKDNSNDILYDYDRPLVQERIIGKVEDACLLFDHGRLVASYTQERLAQFPAEGGPGIFNRSTDRRDVLNQATTLLESLHWHGPAMVEFLRDNRDGKLHLLEINPRFWGTLDLAIAAGVDFPWLVCRVALGEKVAPLVTYRVGLEYRWIVAYARRVWQRQGWSALLSFLRPGRLRTSDICWWDPLPMLAGLFFGRSIT